MQVDRKLIYLLFMLLIMGAFAAMAQNNYGNTLMAFIAYAFAIVFVYQFIGGLSLLKAQLVRLEYLLENFALAVVALLFGLRLSYIYIENIEFAYVGAVTLVVGIYAWKIIKRVQNKVGEDIPTRIRMSAFYLIICLFSTSMLLSPFSPLLGESIGVLAFILIISLIGWVFFQKQFNFKPAIKQLQKGMSSRSNQSLILITAYIIFSFYMGLSKINVLPRLYSEDYPRAYYEMLDKRFDQQDQGEVEQFQQYYDEIGEKYLND